MRSGTTLKNLPTGTKAILLWSTVYTVMILVICILFADVRAEGYCGIIPSTDTGLSKSATVIFYAIVYGGSVINWLIGCRIGVNLDEAAENTHRSIYFRPAWFDIPIIIATIIIVVVFRDYLIGIALASWLFMIYNLCWLWKFRRELGLA